MSKRPSWYDPDAETSPFLSAMAELRRICTRAEYVMPHTKQSGSVILVDAIKDAIDDWAERETGHRDFFGIGLMAELALGVIVKWTF